MSAGALVAFALALQLATTGSGSIRGIVVDTRGGTPIGQVAVRLVTTDQRVVTDSEGRFGFDGIAPGAHELYVSAVDFILVRRTVTVAADGPTSITIALSEGTGTYTEAVDVRGAATPLRRDAGVPAAETIAGRELQALRGVLANDPLRAVQMLPAVAASDDFRSEFAIRGAGLSQMSFTFEGIATPFLLHTVRQVRDSGSVAMINGDVVAEISVANGSYPQRHGNRTGAEIGFRLREGSRDRTQSHVAVSAIDAAAVVEGPLGSRKRGSWLATARKSYLDLIVDKLYPAQNISFGFVDSQTKVVYDLTPTQQLQLATTAGRSKLEREPDTLGTGALRDADNRSVVSVLTWRFLRSPRLSVEQRAAVIHNTFANASRDGAELDGGTTQEVAYRADVVSAVSPQVVASAGGEVRRASTSEREQRFAGGRFQSRESVSATAINASMYAQAQLGDARRSVTPGFRIDRRGLTQATRVSPWIQASLPITAAMTARAGGGMYRQEPGSVEVLGLRGNASLGLERAVHVDAGLTGRLASTSTWQVTVYNRQDRNLVRLPEAESRMAGGIFVPASLTTTYQNALDGYARGIEWLIQRQSPNGLSGWVSYALGFVRYRDTTTGEQFDGDFDQRHTFNAYANYRKSDRVSFSARWRAGSNFPTAGYWSERDGLYYQSTARNRLRIPSYSRVDVRMNRTFAWNERRLTLFVEAINLFNQNNVRVQVPSINRRTFEATGLFESMTPLIPSVGILLDF